MDQLSRNQRLGFVCALLLVIGSCAGMKVDIIGGSDAMSLFLGMGVALVLVVLGVFVAWGWIEKGEG